MENNNTLIEKKISRERKHVLIPQVGDELVFCKDEDAALNSFVVFLEIESIGSEDGGTDSVLKNAQVFITDFFQLSKFSGTLCEPIYMGYKKYGFIGCRREADTWFPDGHFYLYEME